MQQYVQCLHDGKMGGDESIAEMDAELHEHTILTFRRLAHAKASPPCLSVRAVLSKSTSDTAAGRLRFFCSRYLRRPSLQELPPYLWEQHCCDPHQQQQHMSTAVAYWWSWPRRGRQPGRLQSRGIARPTGDCTHTCISPTPLNPPHT